MKVSLDALVELSKQQHFNDLDLKQSSILEAITFSCCRNETSSCCRNETSISNNTQLFPIATKTCIPHTLSGKEFVIAFGQL